MSKPIPKSLHTVRVLTIMANDHIVADNSLTAAQAVDIAVCALGYHPAQDSYGLIAKAIVAVDAAG